MAITAAGIEAVTDVPEVEGTEMESASTEDNNAKAEAEAKAKAESDEK